MKNNILTTKEKIEKKIMEKMKDYRFYNYEIPYSIYVSVRYGIINTEIMRASVSSKVVKEKIEIEIKETEYKTETKRRIKEDINAIVKKNITIDDELSLYINPISYENFPNAVERYLKGYCNTKSIEPNTLSNIINSIPNKLNKAYMRSYNFDKKDALNYLLYDELNQVINVHDTKQNFDDYILGLIKELSVSDFTFLLEGLDEIERLITYTEEINQKINHKDNLIKLYIESIMFGKIKDMKTDECMVTRYKNMVISSL